MTASKILRRGLIILGCVVFFGISLGWVLYFNGIWFRPLSLILPGMGDWSLVPWPDNAVSVRIYQALLFCVISLLGLGLLQCVPAVARMDKKKRRILFPVVLLIWTLAASGTVVFHTVRTVADESGFYLLWMYPLLYFTGAALAGGIWFAASHFRRKKRSVATT